MKKIFTLSLFFFFAAWTAKAQLPDGSIAPNFITTDLDGNTHELYDYLDQGISVVIDLSATWCGPCWNYHQSGALETVYELYGPDGTGEMMVLWIEGDESTNIDCIYGPDGCNSSTYGDWTEGVNYPMINDDFIADLYELAYWPTIYHICPSRLVREIPQSAAEDIYLMNGDCPQAAGVNNASIADYTGFSGIFCNTKTFTPAVTIQNLGEANLTSATIEFWANGAMLSTQDWTGDLALYGLEEISLMDVTISENTDFEIMITSVNGGADDDDTNNSFSGSANLSDVVLADNNMILNLKTDPYPGETYWEILNEDGTVYYSGGNALVVGGADNSGAYSEGEYSFEIPLPADGCYEFAIYDSYGDGICCVEGDGFYQLADGNGNVMYQGGEFEYEDRVPFSVTGGGFVNDNAALVFYSGEGGDLCETLVYNPFFTFHNLGANDITSLTVEAHNGLEALASSTWTGSVESGQYGTIVIEGLTISGSADITFNITEVNGNPDLYDYKNSIGTAFNLNSTKNNKITLTMEIDSYGYEIYWQFANSAGDVFASGGNTVVGPDGGGARVASPSDPGAYEAYALIFEEFELPADMADCFTFLLVDDYGDGMVDGGGGYYTIENGDGEIIAAQDLTSTYFTALPVLIYGDFTSGLEDLSSVESFNVYPNPAQNQLNVSFNLLENMPLEINVYDMLGQKYAISSMKEFSMGNNQIKIDLSDFTNGVYYVKLENNSKQITKKFTVINK